MSYSLYQAHMTSSLFTSPCYLVELLNPQTCVTVDSDVCADLAVAVQRVYEHLKRESASARVEISYDKDGLVEGIGFFNNVNDLISCITVFHLARDSDVANLEGLLQALSSSEPARTQALNTLFKF